LHKKFYVVLVLVSIALIGCQKTENLGLQSPIADISKPTVYGTANSLDFADYFASKGESIISPIRGQIYIITPAEGSLIGESGRVVYIISESLEARLYFFGELDVLNNATVEKGQIIGYTGDALPAAVSPSRANLRMSVLLLSYGGDWKSVNLKSQIGDKN